MHATLGPWLALRSGLPTGTPPHFALGVPFADDDVIGDRASCAAAADADDDDVKGGGCAPCVGVCVFVVVVVRDEACGLTGVAM